MPWSWTSSFSAGNSYVYCASRSLFGLALEGKAPRVLDTVQQGRRTDILCAYCSFDCPTEFLASQQ